MNFYKMMIKKLFLGIFVVGNPFLFMTSLGMECTEQSNLLNNRGVVEIHPVENFTDSPPLSGTLSLLPPFFPGDIWEKIIYQYEVNEENDQISWDIQDVSALSCTCKALRDFINALETYAIACKMMMLAYQHKMFLKNKRETSETSSEDILNIKQFFISLRDVNTRIIKRKTLLMNSSKEVASDEYQIIEDQHLILRTIEADVSPSLSGVFKYAEETPECIMDRDVIVEMSDLATYWGQPAPSYKFKFSREFKRLFGNKKFVFGGTFLLGTIFLCKGISLYHQYPEEQAIEAYLAMFNQTSVEIPYHYWGGRWGELPCYKKYWFNTHFPWMWWSHDQWLGDGRPNGPGYGYFPPGHDTGVSFPGNITEWIGNVSQTGGFNGTYWLEHVMSIYQGAKHDTKTALCNKNPDGRTLSCGSAFTYNSQKYWNCYSFSDICFQLTQVDPTCAYDEVIQEWSSMMKLYWSLGGIGTLFFVWMWLIQLMV